MTESHLATLQMLFACSPALHQPEPHSFKSRSANPMSRRFSSIEALTHLKNHPMTHHRANNPRHPSLSCYLTASSAAVKSP
jgi:hypothetical protein